jgi:hypothetical protein
MDNEGNRELSELKQEKGATSNCQIGILIPMEMWLKTQLDRNRVLPTVCLALGDGSSQRGSGFADRGRIPGRSGRPFPKTHGRARQWESLT